MSTEQENTPGLTPEQENAADALVAALKGATGPAVTRMAELLGRDGNERLVCRPEGGPVLLGGQWFAVSVDGATIGRLIRYPGGDGDVETYAGVVGVYGRGPIPDLVELLAWMLERHEVTCGHQQAATAVVEGLLRD